MRKYIRPPRNEGETPIWRRQVSAALDAPKFVRVDSAATLVLDPAQTVHVIDGTTTITAIDNADDFDGRIIVLIFADELTVQDGPSINLALAGDFVTTNSDTLTLAAAAGIWFEISRSVN